MKKKTLLTLLCAGVLTVGAFTGLTGFADKEDEQKGTGDYALLSTAEVDEEKEITATGTITGVTDVASAVMPAVVSITNKSVQEVQDLFGTYGMYGYGGQGRTYEYETESCGSGIIVGENDEELLICTNYHVVEDAKEITVGFVDDEVYEAVVKGTDSSNDLAVVAVQLSDISDDTMDQIKIAEIGDSDSLQVGQQVVAIGNALGYGQSVTTGIVSALNRSLDLDGYTTAQLIQTDAAINPGNSGGPLLDMNGRVIGINSAKAASSGVEGMGYAIPISTAKDIIEDLMNKKTRTETVSEEDSAFIGITGQDVSEEMASLYGIPQGIFITEVSSGSPAEEAGLKKGDIITKFDGSSVSSMSELKSMLAYYAAGEEVTFVISKANDGEYEESKVEVTLGSAEEYQSQQ
jgi:serine protease Do